jgi:hypothetical protein
MWTPERDEVGQTAGEPLRRILVAEMQFSKWIVFI